ncbi:hypothetical protein COW46_05605 [Candidatus Gracilibacteria bacterium CG17_big_fil_post_rev_8_21_14_2_50_48_13]|nr:MAG: hypothetical protein COW46_05605 [Candidatus Gracilibacteria bacterium CG17_big_fil_post_rev_8_21_14_2_50_48_13]
MATATATAMDQYLEQTNTELAFFELGSVIEGDIIHKDKSLILVDLNGVATGIIAGRDLNDSANTKDSLNIGDRVTAVVIGDENPDGLVVLSLRKASQIRAWDRFKEMYDNKETLTVKALEANKGGLLLEMDGIKAFIPVSQLAPLHYPRVEGANSEKILERLNALIGIDFTVRIINIDEEGRKLILSERAAMEEQVKEALGKLEPGSRVKGKISGIVSYGIFVTFGGLEGLVHISEIAWGHVSSPGKYGKVGDEVEVLVIGVEGGKISLSMKRLKDDPWVSIAQKYKEGDTVEGPVTRLTDFGAFVHVEQDINGLIHLSEISHEVVKDANDFLKVGQRVKAKIITLDLKEHRIGLSIKELLPKPEGAKEEADEKPAKKAKKEEKEESSEEAAE